MLRKNRLKRGISLTLAMVMFLGLIAAVPAFAENDMHKLTFTPAEKATQESWFTAASSAEVSWVEGEGIGFDDDYVLQGKHIAGEETSYTSADNAIRLTFPEALPAGNEYFIQASFYVPSAFNEGKATIRGPGIVLNGNYSNTAYVLPSSWWGAGTTALDTWRTITINTPRMTEPLSSIEFRFLQQNANAANNPDLWYIDNIIIKKGEWDLTLPSLAETYKDSFLLGNITSPNQQDANTTAMYTNQYNVVTAENAMKPQYLSSAKGVYDFSGAEPVVTWAQENNLPLHGHTLVWHSQSAGWLTTDVTRSEARENMQEFINEVAGYYAGKVMSWDVVNEAFDGGSLPVTDWRDQLRSNSPWYRAYANGMDPDKGEHPGDYIYDAFVFARLADPNAILEYNDYNETDDWKREAMALMAEELNEQWLTDPRNTDTGRKLVEGLGMQSHHHTEHPELEEIESSIQRFIEAGVWVSVSELDVPVGHYNGPQSPVLTHEQEVEQAIYYARLFEYYTAYDAHITRVTFWGKADGQSWRANYSPLLFDRALAPKQAFHALLDPSAYLMEQGLVPRSLYDLNISTRTNGVVAELPAEIAVMATAEDLDDYTVTAYLDKDGNKVSEEITLENGTGIISLAAAPAAGAYRVVVNAYSGDTLFASKAVALTIDENPNPTLPFILRNENFAFEERTAAVIIDTGKLVDGDSLSVEDFEAHVRLTRKVDPEVEYYNGSREVVGVYTSQVNDWGTPAATGRYIVLDFPHVGWGDGGTTNDGGYTFDAAYTITYKGEAIGLVDGNILTPGGFVQTGVVSPVLDKYKYATHAGMDYSYFLNTEAAGPLPLVVYFHGGSQGGDIHTPARFSNGATVWANPENQAEFPCHVLVPRTPGRSTDVAAVKDVIDQMVADGKVDPNRIYMTGYSMGSSSTWAFVNEYPEYVAAAVYGAGTGPSNEERAMAVAHMPLWEWVDVDDFAYNGVINRFNLVGHLLQDYMLTILPEVVLYEYPYNGWTFSGHSSWLVAYNEFVDEDRGTVFDWFFGISRVRGIEEVAVNTLHGVAPTLPETVTVSINSNANGVTDESRAVVWNAINPQQYAEPGVFTVYGTLEGIVEKAVAVVTVGEPIENAIVLKGANAVDMDETFVVQVDMENVKSDVFAQDILITYDANLFTLLGVEAAEGIQIISPDDETELVPGTVRVIAFNVEGLTGDAPLFNLTFQATDEGGQSGDITVAQAQLGVAPAGNVLEGVGNTLTVTVRGIPVEGVSLNKSTLRFTVTGASEALVATIDPANASNKTITWSSSNPAVATVDSNGVVTSVGDGVAVITVTTEEGGLTDTCSVTVLVGDLNANGIIDIGDLAMVAYFYGADTSSDNWEQAKVADLNQDGVVDILDLAMLARKILN